MSIGKFGRGPQGGPFFVNKKFIRIPTTTETSHSEHRAGRNASHLVILKVE